MCFLLSIPFMPLYGWPTSDTNYLCRSDASCDKNGEGKLQCWVCDKNNTPEPDTFRQAVVICKYTSYKQKDSNGQDRNTWIKLTMPGNIIKTDSDRSNRSSDPSIRGTEKIGVDAVQFKKNQNTTPESDAWVIILHRKSGSSGGTNQYFYSYITINQVSLIQSLDNGLLLAGQSNNYNNYINTIYSDHGGDAYEHNDTDSLNNDILSSIQGCPIPTLQQSLLTAVTNNDSTTVQTILNNFPAIVSNTDYGGGGNALTTAASYGSDKIVDLLLKFNKINIYFTDNDGNSALQVAKTGNFPAVIAILKNHYAQNLIKACIIGDVAIVNTTFSQCSDVDVNAKDTQGHTALYYAQKLPDSNTNKATIINALTQHGAQAQ